MKELDEDTALSIIFANTKRKKRQVDLITLARSCEYLAHLYGSQAAVAKKVGLHPEMIRQFMTLLRLPEDVKNLVAKRDIDRLDVAYRIALLDNEEQQIAAAKSVSELASSKDVRDVMRIVKRGASVEESTKAVMDAKTKGLHIFVMDFDDDMFHALLQEARCSGMEPAQLVKRVVEDWLARQK